VYLIRRDGTDDYKIGYTQAKSANNRLNSLQVGSSDPLNIVYEFESDFCNILETSLHRRFQYKRKEGEWFELTPTEVLSFLDSCKLLDKNINYMMEHNSYFREQHKK